MPKVVKNLTYHFAALFSFQLRISVSFSLNFYWRVSRGESLKGEQQKSEMKYEKGDCRCLPSAGSLIYISCPRFTPQDPFVHWISIMPLNYAHDVGAVCGNRHGNGYHHVQVHWILRVSREVVKQSFNHRFKDHNSSRPGGLRWAG